VISQERSLKRSKAAYTAVGSGWDGFPCLTRPFSKKIWFGANISC
jgi:hypothetical protein